MNPAGPARTIKRELKGLVTPEKARHHAEILSNRLKARYRHLSRKFNKQGIECFRLYDWDIPEVRLVVDWYAGHAVVGEYVRRQTGPEYLPLMAQAVAGALGLPPGKIHLKRRQTMVQKGPRYQKLGSSGERFVVRERDLRFRVNLDDFLDTGLFSDHRETREIIRGLARGEDFLNLFAYTGAFTCAAACGGAAATTTVDRSETYLDWAYDNLKLNGQWGPRHALVRADAGRFLAEAFQKGRRFSLAFVDPPSFFQDKGRGKAFDINRDHPDLIRSVLKVMRPGATVFFSTNHQRFEPRLSDLPVKGLAEITPATIPEDYRNRRIHRCWRMTAG